jgi:superfamily II DNA/RNA helicase
MEADIDRHILAGKTAAFLLPMISVIIKSPTPAGQGNGRSSWPRGLILAPTRELVQQIFDEVCVCVCVFHTPELQPRILIHILRQVNCCT